MSRKLAITTAMLILAVAVPAWAVVSIRVSDLHNPVLPENPVRTWGRVTSVSPFRISDGRAEIEVTGLSDLDLGDYLWVEGDWNGSTLAVSQATRRAIAYKCASRTEMAYVRAGAFQMGNSGIGNDWSWGSPDEYPQHSVDLPGFWIGKYEVTRGEYRRFMDAGGYSNAAYWSSTGWTWRVSNSRTQPNYWAATQTWSPGQTFAQTDSHPVVGVSYYEAEAFCRWAGACLPTEAQWEKAARWAGDHPNVYPWGDTWNAQKCNNYNDDNPAGGGFGWCQTAPVGSYPSGMSPCGAHDMAGNAWEWCKDWYKSYPGSGSSFDYTGSFRTLRGSSFQDYYGNGSLRCAYRFINYPYYCDHGGGFRLATDGTQPAEVISVPGTPTGNISPSDNVSTTYSTSGSTCSWGHAVEYSFDWGDGASSPWSTSTSASHWWSAAGAKIIKVAARCQLHTSITATSAGLTINVVDSDVPPPPPIF